MAHAEDPLRERHAKDDQRAPGGLVPAQRLVQERDAEHDGEHRDEVGDHRGGLRPRGPDDVEVEDVGDTRAERATRRRPPLLASTATTDARSFQLYGDTPAVCFGPLAENEHGVDERVHLPSLTETAQTIALFTRDWCGLAPG